MHPKLEFYWIGRQSKVLIALLSNWNIENWAVDNKQSVHLLKKITWGSITWKKISCLKQTVNSLNICTIVS